MQINPKVVDLSHHNTVEMENGAWVGFSKLRSAGYVGIINKATQGISFVDMSYAKRRKPALDTGFLYGAYHYLDNTPIAAQVDNFLTHAAPDKHTLLALDHETRGVSLDDARLFLELVQRAIGRYPWLYSGFLVKEQIGAKVDPFWQGIRLWLSHYSDNPKWPPTWAKPTLWQFTGDGVGPEPHEAPGIIIRGGCDINSFDGTDSELAAIWAK